MAIRKYFYCSDENNEYVESEAEFTFFPGFALCQKQKCIESFHQAIQKIHSNASILEISSKSRQRLGVELSAFNLTLLVNNMYCPIETVFQSSKVFDTGGPYIDLLKQPPAEAKKDERLHTDSKLIAFSFQSVNYPTEPKTAFYDWIYCSALYQHKDLAEAIVKYNTFTDIEFNHKKSINCQARSAAIFVSLTRRGILKEAMQNIDSFIRIVYSRIKDPNDGQQISIFTEEHEL